MESPALFDAFPALRGAVPWQPLGRFPTPVERVDGLLPPSVELWVKRDDQSGDAYGGNKVRKLEFLLAEAERAGVRRLATIGGYGSHHVLATAIYGRQRGFTVDAVVFPQPITEHVRATLRADAGAGATLHPARTLIGVPRQWLRARRGDGGRRWIAAGGSSPTGTLGYVSAAFELRAQQERGECPSFDAIYLALGSCGTAAGLVAGLAMAGLPTRVRAVRVVDRLVSNRAATLRLAARTRRLLERHAPVPPAPTGRPRLTVDHRFFGGSYGLATDEGRAAVERTRRAGLVLEPTYTGKAFAALLADAHAGLLDGQRVLFWHTFSSADLSSLLAAAPPGSALPAPLDRLY